MENPDVLGKIDIFKSSEKEIKVATGEPDLLKAIRRISEHGVKTVIVTKGIEGSILYIKNSFYEIPASRPEVVVDATGAGDVFIGAFLAEYVKKKDMVWCACVGSASASFVIEKLGPEGFRGKKEIYKRADQVYERVRTIT
jgi:sugar/nucleoside kinase (ribokinase family)